ncbi:SxtJ family membrane protein [Candidatus Pelagibacter sp.]|nr:SxtJ family membrane protein [Candidatus Pelagibacter sp.]
MVQTEDIKLGSNRSFGIVFFVVFLLISLYPLLNNEHIKIWSLIISLIFLFLGLLNSKFLSPLNKIWFKFGLFLGKLISPLIMGFIFFLVVTPIGLLMRMFGKDLLNLKFNTKKSYWIKKDDLKSKMKNQF